MNKDAEDADMYRRLREELRRELISHLYQHYKTLETALREIAAEEAALEYDRRELGTKNGERHRAGYLPRESSLLAWLKTRRRLVVAFIVAIALAGVAWAVLSPWLASTPERELESSQADEAPPPPADDLTDTR
jgi:hypothetical protein